MKLEHLIIILGIVFLAFYFTVAIAETSNVRGMCDHIRAYTSVNGTITNPEPYFEIYFWGDNEVKWCDEKQ